MAVAQGIGAEAPDEGPPDAVVRKPERSTCEAGRITTALFLIVLVLANIVVIRAVLRRRSRLVGQRGLGTGADVGRLRNDVPRVRIQSLVVVGPSRARLRFDPVSDSPLGDATVGDAPEEGPAAAGSEVEYLIEIDERASGFRILHDWLEHRSVLGIVMPSGTPLIRLRGIDDLQPLTLRRLAEPA